MGYLQSYKCVVWSDTISLLVVLGLVKLVFTVNTDHTPFLSVFNPLLDRSHTEPQHVYPFPFFVRY